MRLAGHKLIWALACAAALGCGAMAGPAPEALTVLNFQNRHPGDGNDWLQKAFPDMLLTHFVQHGRFTVVERERMEQLFAELRLREKGVVGEGDASAFARIAKVQKVVYGHYAVEGSSIQVTAFIFDAVSNSVDSVASVSGGLQSLCELEHSLFANLLKRLGAPLSNTDRAQLACVVSDNLSAASHFYQGMGAFDDGDYPAALVQFEHAARQDTGYGEARLWAAKMYSYLKEPEHAALTLREFAHDLPAHPLLAQARLRVGLILLQELNRPKLAAAEFEKLVAMEPAVQVSPSVLREQHWEEYRTMYRGLWHFIWTTPEEQDNAAAHKLKDLGKERAQRMNIFVEGWYRLGKCHEAAGEALKAFQAYDQGRAVCRWLLLDESAFTDRLYGAAYGTYKQLLLMDGIDLPTPDWVLPMKGDQPRALVGDQMFRYYLEKCYYGSIPARGNVVLQAPKGEEFDTISVKCCTRDGRTPQKNALWIEDCARPQIVPFTDRQSKTNCLTLTRNVERPFDYRVIQVDARGLDEESQIDSVTVTATYRLWQAIYQPAQQPANTRALVYIDPTNSVLSLDGQVVRGDSFPFAPGRHRFELKEGSGRTASVTIQFQPGAVHRVYLSLNNPWHDTGVRLPEAQQPDICVGADGKYWLAYVAGREESGDDIWLTQSADRVKWSETVSLSCNSLQSDTAPRLVALTEGGLLLAFVSDRRQSGTSGLYVSRSTDGREWSAPRRLADVGSIQDFVRDADGNYSLRYRSPHNPDQTFLVKSENGIRWSDPIEVTSKSSLREKRVPMPWLPQADFSRVLHLPDRSCVVAASQSIGTGSGTLIFTATEDELRRAAENNQLEKNP